MNNKRVLSYTEYHNESMEAGDVDPSVRCLTYLADRYELNIEQRYWVAYLYGLSYCASTVLYMYNEFPDYECVDVGRLSRWWKDKKKNCVFQTDRLRLKSNDQVVDSFVSYRNNAGSSQQDYFVCENWRETYKKIERIKYFGRFSLFNYLDVLNAITDVNHKPDHLNMIEAVSCRNGLAYAIGRPDLVDKKITKQDAILLHNEFVGLLRSQKGNVFQIETTLCAYKKYMRGARYVGFYLDRMHSEIRKMAKEVNEGVYWDVLWQYREETYNKKYLAEFN
jgi:hypothetical protein